MQTERYLELQCLSRFSYKEPTSYDLYIDTDNCAYKLFKKVISLPSGEALYMASESLLQEIKSISLLERKL